MTGFRFFSGMALTVFLLANAPARAQETTEGSVAKSAVGKVGERQQANEAAQSITPTARIENRIPNRIENRLRNRIDRFYDPQANTTSPFNVAADQARAKPRQRSR